MKKIEFNKEVAFDLWDRFLKSNSVSKNEWCSTFSLDYNYRLSYDIKGVQQVEISIQSVRGDYFLYTPYGKFDLTKYEFDSLLLLWKNRERVGKFIFYNDLIKAL